MSLLYGKTSAAQPTRIADATAQQVRLSATGEQIVVPVGSGEYGLAMEGSYYKAINSTYNTAVAVSIAAATTFSETQGSITIRNTNPVNGKDIILDYIRITLATAGTLSTNYSFAIQTDNAIRYSSGGTALTINNANSGIPIASSGALIHAGALTLVTSTVNARKLCPGALIIKNAITAVNDVFLFNFGNVDSVANVPGVAVATPCGPVILPAGANHTFVLHLFGASQSAAPTGFFEIAYYER
jgi:hypothetical protein